jgi:hypothetical protein
MGLFDVAAKTDPLDRNVVCPNLIRTAGPECLWATSA